MADYVAVTSEDHGNTTEPDKPLSKSAVAKQFLAGTSASLAVFISGCWLGWPSPAIQKIVAGKVDFEVSYSQISWIVAYLEFGNMLSPIPSGYLADSLGRKKTLLLAATIFIITGMLAIFGTSAEFLFAARIGAGIGKGMAYTVVPIYLGEIASVQVRGALSTMFLLFFQLGTLFEYSIGPFVSFRQLNLISLIVPLMFLLSFICFPDSPYYLLMKGRKKHAKESLAWFRNVKKTERVLEQELNDLDKMVKREMGDKRGFKDIIATPGKRRALMIVLFLSFFKRFGGITPMLAYTAITLPKTGGYFDPDFYMIIFGIFGIVGGFTATPLMDRLGRKPLLIVSCACCALCTGISGVFYWAAGPLNDTDYNWIPYVCFFLYGLPFGVGLGIIPTTFVAELFPTNIKSLASALSSITLALASFIMHKSYLYVKLNYGTHYMYAFFTLSNLSSMIFAIFVVFETKGKTFSQIQDILNKQNEKTTTPKILSYTKSGKKNSKDENNDNPDELIEMI